MACVAVDSGPQTPLHIAYRAGADTGSLCQFLLGHPGSQAMFLERGAKLLFRSHDYPDPHPIHLADPVTETVGWFHGAQD
jgi:hypothetical protein